MFKDNFKLDAQISAKISHSPRVGYNKTTVESDENICIQRNRVYSSDSLSKRKSKKLIQILKIKNSKKNLIFFLKFSDNSTQNRSQPVCQRLPG